MTMQGGCPYSPASLTRRKRLTSHQVSRLLCPPPASRSLYHRFTHAATTPPHPKGAPVYVQLTSRQHLDLDGRQRTYVPGDWVNVGKQLAIQLITQGSARLAASATLDLDALDCGAIVPRHGPGAGTVLAQLHRLSGLGFILPVHHSEDELPDPDVPLPFLHTLQWSGGPFRVELLPVGFTLLQRWEVIAPMWSYDELARDLGTEEDRRETFLSIPDLRIPVYDTRLLFLRRSTAVAHLLEAWYDECQALDGETDPRLAFMRALWHVKPLILAAPPTWMADHNVDVSTQVGV